MVRWKWSELEYVRRRDENAVQERCVNGGAEVDKRKTAAQYIVELRIGQHRRVDWCSGGPLEQVNSVQVSDLLWGVWSGATDKERVKADEDQLNFSIILVR